MEVRRENNGDLVYKDEFSAPISGILQADYRMVEQKKKKIFF